MRLTNFLIKKLAEINGKIVQFETEKKHYSAEDVVNAIKPKPAPTPKQVAKLPLFKDVADNYLQDYRGLTAEMSLDRDSPEPELE